MRAGDAHEGITEQDVSLLGLVLERGRALVVVTNKWDGLSASERKHVRDELDRRLPFLDFAERITISALHGTAVGDLLYFTSGGDLWVSDGTRRGTKLVKNISSAARRGGGDIDVVETHCIVADDL